MKRVLNLLPLLLIVCPLVLVFQNCQSDKSASNNPANLEVGSLSDRSSLIPTSSENGGNGSFYDLKMSYYSVVPNTCAQSGAHRNIPTIIEKEGDQLYLVRENCEDVPRRTLQKDSVIVTTLSPDIILSGDDITELRQKIPEYKSDGDQFTWMFCTGDYTRQNRLVGEVDGIVRVIKNSKSVRGFDMKLEMRTSIPETDEFQTTGLITKVISAPLRLNGTYHDFEDRRFYSWESGMSLSLLKTPMSNKRFFGKPYNAIVAIPWKYSDFGLLQIGAHCRYIKDVKFEDLGKSDQ